MRFKHAIGITLDCSAEVFKYLIYRVLTGIIFYSLTFLILRTGLAFIMESGEIETFRSLVSEFFRALGSALAEGTHLPLQDFQSQFHAAVSDFMHLLATHIGTIVWSVIGVAIMYILQRFVNGLAQFAIASTVNDRMASFARTRFSVSYFSNIGRAALYQLIYVPLAFIYDALSLVACWFLFFYIPSLLPGYGAISILLAIMFTVAVVLFTQALKLTLISAWMPAMIVGGKSVWRAIGDISLERKDFWRRFGNFLVACYLIAFINVGFAVFTAGSGLLFTVPLSFIFLIVIQFVNYYHSTSTKYFIDKNVVVEGDNDELNAHTMSV